MLQVFFKIIIIIKKIVDQLCDKKLIKNQLSVNNNFIINIFSYTISYLKNV